MYVAAGVTLLQKGKPCALVWLPDCLWFIAGSCLLQEAKQLLYALQVLEELWEASCTAIKR